MRTGTQISTGDTTVIMTIGRFVEKGFEMGDKEWDAINKLIDELGIVKGKMSVLLPILIISIGNFLALIGALAIALISK